MIRVLPIKATLVFPWLSSRKSGISYGIGEDARYLADAISEQLA
jgi:hypothetical protein